LNNEPQTPIVPIYTLFSNGKNPIMSVLIAVGALGLAGWYLAPSTTPKIDLNTKNQRELREAMHTGFLRGVNTSKTNTISSEETRIIRNPSFGTDVRGNAGKAWLYYKEKNDILGKMSSGANVLINQSFIRPSLQKKPGLLALPNKADWGEAFGDIPNATFDIPAGMPAEMMTKNWRDQYGDAGGFPRNGKPNVVLNELYVGNPWGAGGQLFQAVGNQHRDPKYADTPPSGILKKPKGTAPDRYKARVKFTQ